MRRGTYYFQSLSLESNSTLLVDNSEGEVRVLVGHPGTDSHADPDSYLTLRGTIQRSRINDFNFLLGYAGNNTVPIEKDVEATLVAPHAKLELYSIYVGGYEGAYFGGGIELHQNTNMMHHPFEAWKTQVPHDPLLVEGTGEWQHPFDRETYFFEGWQGVAHSGGYWFSSNAQCVGAICSGFDSHLWATPVEVDYGSDDAEDLGYIQDPFESSGYNHVGDLTFVPAGGATWTEGLDWVVAPLEGHYGNTGLGLVLADNLTLGLLTGPPPHVLPYVPEPCGQTKIGWVAFNPVDGLLYASGHKNIRCINAYSIDATTGVVSFEKSVMLKNWQGELLRVETPGDHDYIQGGEISSSGKLYLVIGADPGGILIIDLATGVPVGERDVEINMFDAVGNQREELEGITLWDLTQGQAPNIGGHVHIGLLDLDWAGTDQLYFKHYVATYPERM